MAEKSGSFRDGVDLERWAVNPTVSFLLGPRTTITIGYEHLYDDRTADRGIPAQNGRPFETDPSTFFGNAEQSHARSVVDGAYAVVDYELGGGMRFRNTLRATRYDKFYQNIYPDNANASSVNAAGNLRLAAYNNANDRTNAFNQSDLTWKVRSGAIEHSLLAGIEIGHQDSTSKRNTGFFGALPTDTLIVVPARGPARTAQRVVPTNYPAVSAARALSKASVFSRK